MAKFLRDMTEPELQTYMELAARATESIMPGGPSASERAFFSLLVFDEPGIVQYISSANRRDAIKALRETADRLESRENMPR